MLNILKSVQNTLFLSSTPRLTRLLYNPLVSSPKRYYRVTLIHNYTTNKDHLSEFGNSDSTEAQENETKSEISQNSDHSSIKAGFKDDSLKFNQEKLNSISDTHVSSSLGGIIDSNEISEVDKDPALIDDYTLNQNDLNPSHMINHNAKKTTAQIDPESLPSPNDFIKVNQSEILLDDQVLQPNSQSSLENHNLDDQELHLNEIKDLNTVYPSIALEQDEIDIAESQGIVHTVNPKINSEKLPTPNDFITLSNSQSPISDQLLESTDLSDSDLYFSKNYEDNKYVGEFGTNSVKNNSKIDFSSLPTVSDFMALKYSDFIPGNTKPVTIDTDILKQNIVDTQDNIIGAQENIIGLQENNLEPQETTLEPQESILQPQENNLEPQESILQPQETTLELQETTLELQETTLELQETTLELQETTLELQETTLELQETTLEPQENNFERPESILDPQENDIINKKELNSLDSEKYLKENSQIGGNPLLKSLSKTSSIKLKIKQKLENLIIPSSYVSLYKITAHHIQKSKISPDISVENANQLKMDTQMSISQKAATDIIIEIQQEMNSHDLNDDYQLLNLLMEAQIKANTLANAYKTFIKILSLGHLPRISIVISLSKLALRNRDKTVLFQIIRNMEKFKIPDNQEIYENLILLLLSNRESEFAYLMFNKLIYLKFVPSQNVAHLMFQQMIRDGEEERVYQLASHMLKNNQFLLDSTILLLLRSFAQKYMAEPTLLFWEKCNQSAEMLITEGDCLLVLATAARNGEPNLAADVLRVLDLKEFCLQEYHLEPLFEAFVNSEDWLRAIETLHIIRSSNMCKTKATTSYITKKLVEIHHLGSIMPQSLFKIFLDNQNDFPLALDANVINSLLEALIFTEQISSAVELSTMWFSRAGIKKNADTFSILLKACLEKHNSFAAKNIFDSALQDVTPTESMYEYMILTALTQSYYEDAFIYLEAMKAKGFVPQNKVYSSLAAKCENYGDPRFEAVVEEMKLYGYSPNKFFQKF
ncbi:hypothetical protein BB561_005862 [Smittium simulii]|uniref:Pentacotripeptide-repeat region of PRORP domain-containing protein n=1 Tax=Smittium simulii TaxID=133385 RepID=A0A2T9Y7Z7_9FUNG|nr:hypothetical protein BB561_005862 [Smittium simulii]